MGGNLLETVGLATSREQFEELLALPGVRLERIASTGQASPPGFWYDQAWHEWVLLLRGAAALLIEGEAAARRLAPGDHLFIPAHRRHRVEWTDPTGPTLWLALHLEPRPATTRQDDAPTGGT